jgi:hypothetical protein
MFALVVLWVVLTAAGAVLVFALTGYAPIALGVQSDSGFPRPSSIYAVLGLPALAVALLAGGILLAHGRLSGRGACLALAAATVPALLLFARTRTEAAEEHEASQNAQMVYEGLWQKEPGRWASRDEFDAQHTAHLRYTANRLRDATLQLGVLVGVMFGGVAGGVLLSLRRLEQPDPGADGGRGSTR